MTELLSAENEQVVQQKLADKGVEMSLTEIELMGEMMEGLKDGKITEEQLENLSKCGELSDEDLENVAGGGADNLMAELIKDNKQIIETLANQGSTPVGKIVAGVAVCVVAVAGIGYGIYDAVRRRW